MNPIQFEKFIRSCHWQDLQCIRGSAHSSIIGFISLNWISSKKYRFILDTAPSQIGGKKGRRFADLLLCETNEAVGVVEVESSIKNYIYKLNTLYEYLNNHKDFPDLQFGLLLMLNYPKYQHSWENIKSIVKQKNKALGLVSFTKQEDNTFLNQSKYSRLHEKRGYFHWLFDEIKYWFYFPSTKEEFTGTVI